MEPRQPSHPTTTTRPAASQARPGANILWRSRSTLYKFSILLLIVVWPLNLLSLVLPYWLEGKGIVGNGRALDQNRAEINYGLWQLCAEGSGCYNVHSVHSDVGVGVWLYAAAFFTLLSVVCHGVASVCGALQNFLPRRISRECTCFLKRVLHRDCAYAEDVGFIAGFVGMTANIIVMMSTKDIVSDGARYSFSFGLSFFSTAMALVSSVALTKSHYIASPSPRRRHNAARAPQPEPVRGAAWPDPPVQVFHGGATAAASTAARDSASSGRAMGDSASAAIELGDLASLGDQADTESASLRVQLGAPLRGSSGDSTEVAHDHRRGRDHYDPELYGSGQRESSRDQRDHRDQIESSRDQRQIYGQQSQQNAREPSRNSGFHENQAYARERGDFTDLRQQTDAFSSEDARRSRQDNEHYGRQHSPMESARPKQKAATAYWRGREEESTRPQDVDAKVLEESDMVREAERRTRWHGRSSSRSRSRSRSRERRHSRRRQNSGDTASLPASQHSVRNNVQQQPSSSGNSRSSGLSSGNSSGATAQGKHALGSHAQHQPHSSGNFRSSGLVRDVEMENIHASASTGELLAMKKHSVVNCARSGNSRTTGLVRSVEMENIPAAVSSSPDPPPPSTIPASLRQQTPLTEHLRSSSQNHTTTVPISNSTSSRTEASTKLYRNGGDVRPGANDVRLRNSRSSNYTASSGGGASGSTRL